MQGMPSGKKRVGLMITIEYHHHVHKKVRVWLLLLTNETRYSSLLLPTFLHLYYYNKHMKSKLFHNHFKLLSM